MKRLFQISIVIIALATVSIGLQSFMKPPPQAPTQTTIFLTDADGYYAVKVGCQGYLFTDPYWWKLVYDTQYNTGDPETFYTGEKYEYNTSNPGSCGVWTKDYSYSSWVFRGNIGHEECTLTHDSDWIYTITFSFNDLVDPN